MPSVAVGKCWTKNWETQPKEGPWAGWKLVGVMPTEPLDGKPQKVHEVWHEIVWEDLSQVLGHAQSHE